MAYDKSHKMEERDEKWKKEMQCKFKRLRSTNGSDEIQILTSPEPIHDFS